MNIEKEHSIPEGNERVNWFCMNILLLLNTEQMKSLKNWINSYELENTDISNSHDEQAASANHINDTENPKA